MKNNGTLISFVGSRGSGKTTVANFVCQYLKDSGNACVKQHPGFSRRPFLRGVLTAISLWRFFDLKLVTYFGFCGRKKRILPSLYRFYLPLAFAHDLHELSVGRSDFLVYDSNILRGLISALSSDVIDSTKITDLYKNKILSKVNRIIFVVIETNPAEAVSRWIARDKIELSSEEKQKAISERLKLTKETNLMIEVLAKLPEVKVVRLNGNIAPEINAREIVNSVIN